MVTKYDIFEIVYKNGPIKPNEVVKKLEKSKKEYKNIYRILKELEKEKFIEKVRGSFEAKKEGKPELLYKLIYHCLRNNINHNFLIDDRLAEFIANGLKKGELNQKNAKLHPKTFAKYIEILNKYGLILLISKKPLKARIFYNALINNLLIYFDIKNLNIKKMNVDYLGDIEKNLALYKRLRRKNEYGFMKIIEEFEILFVQHSLALEGNPITLPDTIKILREKIIPSNLRSEDVDELKNYQNAILQMIKDAQDKKQLRIDDILNYHKIAMLHKPEIAGKIRRVEVIIKGNPKFKVSKAKNIKNELEKIILEYNNFVNKKNGIREIISFVSYFHNEFQHIHPFIDGNSRITRLITFHLLHLEGIPILDIPFGLLDEYLEDTKGSKIRNDRKLFESLQKIILYNLKKINERLIV